MTLFVAAVAWATWWAGWKYGLASVVASFALLWQLIAPAQHKLELGPHEQTRLAGFLCTVGIVWFAVGSKRDAQGLHERDQRWLEKILRRTADGVITTDSQGRVTYMNPAGASLTGWTPEEGHRRFLWEVFRLVDPDTGTAAEPNAANQLRREILDTRSGRRLLSTRDGTQVRILETSAPIFLKDGSLDGVVVVFRREGVAAAA